MLHAEASGAVLNFREHLLGLFSYVFLRNQVLSVSTKAVRESSLRNTGTCPRARCLQEVRSQRPPRLRPAPRGGWSHDLSTWLEVAAGFLASRGC